MLPWMVAYFKLPTSCFLHKLCRFIATRVKRIYSCCFANLHILIPRKSIDTPPKPSPLLPNVYAKIFPSHAKWKRNNFHLNVSLSIRKGFQISVIESLFWKQEERRRRSLRLFKSHLCKGDTRERDKNGVRLFFLQKPMEFNKDGNIPFASPLFRKECSLYNHFLLWSLFLVYDVEQ